MLDDAAGSTLPTGAGSTPAGGTFRPTDLNNGTDTFPAPAPASLYSLPAPSGAATFATAFNASAPNGTWSLYVVDDSLGGGTSTVAGGWSLAITTNAVPPAITSTNQATFSTSQAGSFNVVGTGNPAPTFITPGPLPNGVTLSSSGLLSGTPASGTAGNYAFTITATNGVLPNATQSFTLIARSPLTDWRTLHGLSSNGSQDLGNLSGDGVVNLLKYAFNLAPVAGDLAKPNVSILAESGTAGLPRIGVDAQGRLTVAFVRRKAATDPGVAYTVETGSTLADFTALNLSGADVSSIDATWERVTVTDPAIALRRFGRVRISATVP